MIYFPSKSELVPVVVPSIIILAPGRGCPVLSVIVPFTVVCAKEITDKSITKSLKVVFML